MFFVEKRGKNGLDVLWYEIGMLHASFIHPLSHRNTVDHNLYIECFLLHARNLIYFLHDHRSSEDIRCSDFYVDKIATAFTPKEIRKLNRHLSHIASERKKQKIIWNLEKIFNEIAKALILFLDRVSDSYFPTPEGHSREDFKGLLEINHRITILNKNG